jgi:hypothetical protein
MPGMADYQLEYPDTLKRMFYGQNNPPLFSGVPPLQPPPLQPAPTIQAQQWQDLLHGGLRQQMPSYLPQIPGPPPLDSAEHPAMGLKEAGRMYRGFVRKPLENPWFQYNVGF